MNVWFSCEPSEPLGVCIHTGDVDEIVPLCVFFDDSLIDMPDELRSQYAEKLSEFIQRLKAP